MKTKRSLECLKLVIVQNRRKKCLAIFLWAAAMLVWVKWVRVTSDCEASWMSSSCHISIRYSVLEAKSRFLCRGMIPLSIYVESEACQLSLWLVSQISVQRNIWLVLSWTVTYSIHVARQVFNTEADLGVISHACLYDCYFLSYHPYKVYIEYDLLM